MEIEKTLDQFKKTLDAETFLPPGTEFRDLVEWMEKFLIALPKARSSYLLYVMINPHGIHRAEIVRAFAHKIIMEEIDRRMPSESDDDGE